MIKILSMIANSIKKILVKTVSGISEDTLGIMISSQKEHIIKRLRSCGKNVRLYMPIVIESPGNVQLGDDVSIAPFVHMWGAGGITIGDRVMIASHVAITSLTHDHTKIDMYKTLIKGEIFIEDDVWIGAHSVIMPGVVIGHGAVIGAGSIVTKNVDANSIVMGMPAKPFKSRSIKGEADC